MKTVVFTSDNHNWLLKGFFHQWEKYALAGKNYENDPLEIEVAGYTNPGFLPETVPFYSIGKFADYPVEKWSDGIIKYLNGIPDDLVMILLEDYWMIRKINRQAIYNAYGYMMDNPGVVRFDVAADRMFSREARYVESYGGLDICAAKGDYSFSTQASIWRRKDLLSLMKPGETPWQAELRGSDRLNKTPLSVVGTYNWLMNYAIVVNKGELDKVGAWMYPARSLTANDWRELSETGCLEMPEAVQ